MNRRAEAFGAILEQFSLSGHTAVVTGIGPGIGETVARAYAAAGANVVMCARTAGRVEALAREIVAAGGNAVGVGADVGKPAELGRVVAIAHESFGPITITFGNAAAFDNGLATSGEGRVGTSGLELDDADWRAAFDVNLLAPFNLAKLVVGDMQSEGYGSIIHVLSTAGFTPLPNIGAWAYGATKAGLATLTRYMAKELGPKIRVNNLCPGTITPTGEIRDAFVPLLPRIPLGRVGSAQEVAAAALYLASPASSYVSGQTLFVDGGRVNTVA